MKATRNWQTVGGWVLHGLLAAMMILAGSAKVFGLFPPEEVAKLGLSLPIQVIGAGELARPSRSCSSPSSCSSPGSAATSVSREHSVASPSGVRRTRNARM